MSGYTGSPFAPVPAEQAPAFYYKLRQAARTRHQPTQALDLNAIATIDNLAAVYDAMKGVNGPGAGPDGLTYTDIGRSELFALLRPLSKALLEGTYRPGPARKVSIPKAGGQGTRTLRLRNLMDRVVAKALQEALSPFWETIFLEGSHGFRSNRSPLTLLAQLELAMVRQGRWVLVVDDIKGAFDHVQLGKVMADHERHFPSNALLSTVDAVLRGGDESRQIGMDQGSPYSPTALNVHLHHRLDAQAHDLGANPGSSTPWYRYADNLCVACQDVEEGKQVRLQLRELLQSAGLALKGEHGGEPVDLKRGGQIHMLGFVLFKRGSTGTGLGYKVGPCAWDELEKSLYQAHEAPCPGTAAHAAIQGWIASYGPAFFKRQDRTVSYILRLASSLGFHELPSAEVYERECRQAWHRWKSLITHVGSSGSTGSQDNLYGSKER